MLPEAIARGLREHAPHGTLSNLGAVITLNGESPPRFRVDTAFANLGYRPGAQIPGVDGLEGQLRADNDGLRVDLSSQNVVARFPGLFRDPLHATQLRGEIDITRHDDHWTIRSDHLLLENADLHTETLLRLDVPADGSPLLRLVAHFRDGDGSKVSTYLPAGIMPPNAVRWLDRGIVTGKVRNGGVLFNGRFADFPFDDGSGHFEVTFNASDMVIDYKDQWPRLEEVEAQARFINRRMEIHGVGGRILGAELPKVAVVIPNLLRTDLHISGQARGDGTEMLRFLMETPLHDNFGIYFKGMDLKGPTELDLSLLFPFASGGDIRAGGRIRFDGNTLRVADLGNEFRDLTGELRFTGDGLYAQGVRATLNDRPVRVDVATDAQGLVTQVDLSINASVGELGGAVAAPLEARMSGRTDWNIDLGFRRLRAGDRKPDTEIVVGSDLQGIVLDLPPPFGKRAEQTRRLRLSSLVGVDEPAPVRINYGDFAELLIDLRPGEDGPEPRAAELVLGGARAQVPTAPGLRVRGQLPTLDLDALGDGNPEGLDTLPSGLQPREITLRIDALTLARQIFHDAHVIAKRGPDGWLATIDSREAKGEILLPAPARAGAPSSASASRTSLRMHMDRLYLAAPQGDAPDAASAPVDPRTLPGFAVSIRDLRVGDMHLGRVDLTASPIADGLRIDRVALDNGSTRGHGHGAWRADAEGAVSNIELNLTSDALDQALKDFGFEEVIDGGRGTIRLMGGWDGAPADFAMSRFDGNLNVRFSDGRLLEVDPGAGGRVFGLFSLTALPRRLRLDFTDLFRKGFSFDVIEGSFNLIEGVAYTVDLSLRGPPALVDIAGDTDFINQTYNQTVTVTPRLGNTVAAASALLNPAVGAAVLVVNKLLKNPLDRASRFQYEMRGPWDDPQITRLRDDEGDDTAKRAPATTSGDGLRGFLGGVNADSDAGDGDLGGDFLD